MSHLNSRDLGAVTELKTMLETLHLDEPPVMGRVMPLVQSVVGWGHSWAYGLHRDDSGAFAVSWASAGGFEVSRAIKELQGLLRNGLLAFDPLRPAPWQRNRLLRMERLIESSRRPAATRQVVREGFNGFLSQVKDQPRVLLCDGPLFLGWFGLFLPDQATSRELAIVSALAPTVRERLRLEQRWQRAQWLGTALTGILDNIAAPACLVDARGTPLVSNEALTRWFDRSPAHARRTLRAAIAGEAGWLRRPVKQGLGEQAWLLIRASGPILSGVVAEVSHKAKLTQREQTVLSHLLNGLSTSMIANALQVSERTVEAHVGQVLRKTGSDSRARLAAHLWAGRP